MFLVLSDTWHVSLTTFKFSKPSTSHFVKMYVVVGGWQWLVAARQFAKATTRMQTENKTNTKVATQRQKPHEGKIPQQDGKSYSTNTNPTTQ